jgi:hypothetical protein
VYRIVSRFLALFYFYLPPRLSFSLLVKRATTLSLSSFRGGKISEEKEEIRERESSKTKRPFFARDFNLLFHLRNRKKRSLVVDDWYAHTQTHRHARALSLSRSSFLSAFLPLQTGVAFGGVFFLPQSDGLRV